MSDDSALFTYWALIRSIKSFVVLDVIAVPAVARIV